MITSKQLLKYIGNQIKRYRKSAYLSQEQLAEKIDIATNTMSAIETGSAFMTIATLEKLLNTLNVSPKDFFDFPEVETASFNKAEAILTIFKKIKHDEKKLSLLYNFIRLLV